MVIAQPYIAFQPNGARAAGVRKIPVPMVLPITSARQVQNPIWRGGAWISCVIRLAFASCGGVGNPNARA